MRIEKALTLYEKLNILTDAAKYDVACTSSGTERKNDGNGTGSCQQSGICHSFSADGRCISLLKILFTNECIYDCKYCVNRRTNDVMRTSFTPEEVCTLTMEFYRRNYIEGLFLSSGILKSPDFTMGLVYETLWKLRNEHHFFGYIHVKAIPGASPEIIEKIGFLADRMSTNLELPTKESLKELAPNKSHKNMLMSMKQIQIGSGNLIPSSGDGYSLITKTGRKKQSKFVTAGQSTQMIIGATGESDYTLLQTTQQLYQGFDLKRVFYSAYIPLNEDPVLPEIGTPPPLLREHRLYQADWLLRFYGFQADELLTIEKPNFNELLDPKCDWALRHLELFPVEVETASYAELLRVPGVGPKSASRIVNARRYGRMDFTSLKKMGVVLKRAHYFITCGGKQMYHTPLEETYITRQLVSVDRKESWEMAHANEGFSQMTLADFGIG